MEGLEKVKDILLKILGFTIKYKKPVGYGLFGLLLFMSFSSQWKAPLTTQALQNPNDIRDTPSFNEGQLIQQQSQGIAEQKTQIRTFIRDEEQRIEINLATLYIGLATYFQSLPSHPCNGLTTGECLSTFEANRIADLQSTATPIENPTNDLSLSVDNVLRQYSQLQKYKSLLLAIVLSTPKELRSSEDQSWIDSEYPVLNSGLPVNEMKARPRVLIGLIQELRNKIQDLSKTSAEETARIEFCMKQPEDIRVMIKECQR